MRLPLLSREIVLKDSTTLSLSQTHDVPIIQMLQESELQYRFSNRKRGCHIHNQASKRRYFYGLKLHLMVTGNGQSVEFFLTPGSCRNTKALKMYRSDLPPDTLVTDDKAYNKYRFGDMLLDTSLNLLPLRKKNSQRAFPLWLIYLLAYCRKVVETTGSLIESLLLKHIHAVTSRSFELKVTLFILANSFNSFHIATVVKYIYFFTST